MKAVVQRVSEASVEVEGKVVGQISRGLVVLLGIHKNDTREDLDYLVKKIPELRIFEDARGKMNLSLADINGAILAISQFTLHANTRKGRRPSFIDAAPPEIAEPLYNEFIREISRKGFSVAKGIFGAMMLVKIFNQGPVTIILDSNDRLTPRH